MFLQCLIFGMLAVLSITVLWWYYIFFTFKKYLKQFPTVTQVPLLGIAHRWRNTCDIYTNILHISNVFGRNVFTMIGFLPVLLTSDPKIFSLILGSHRYVNKPNLYNLLAKSVGNSVLLVNGHEWKLQRKTLNPALNYGNVMNNIHIFNAKSDNLIKVLAEEVNKNSTEVNHFIENWALSQAYDTLIDCGEETKGKQVFLIAAKTIMKIAVERAARINEYYSITYVFTKNFWVERKLIKAAHGHLRSVIKRKKLEIQNGNITREKPILMDILLKQMATDENVTETFIVRQLTLMIAAAFDTTASAISFALYNLSAFPIIQQKAYEEIASILGDNIHQPITHDHVKTMVYLDLVIKESMRLTTPVPFFLRQLEEDVHFDGTTLPKGLTIMLMSCAMHLDPDLYPDPENFVPQRFQQYNLNPNRYSYSPFSGGVRNCIGQKYAMLAMKIVLAKILLNYELVDVQHTLRFSCEITLRSKTGVKIAFRRRKPLSQKA